MHSAHIKNSIFSIKINIQRVLFIDESASFFMVPPLKTRFNAVLLKPEVECGFKKTSY